MKYYMVQPEAWGELLNFVDNRDWGCLERLNDGDASGWRTPQMRWCRRIRGKTLKRVDFPFVPHGSVVAGKQRAIDALDGVTEGCQGWWPLSAPGRDSICVAQVVRIAALDEGKSHMDFLGAGTIFPEDEVYALKDSVVSGLDMFRLASPFEWVFVSSRFVKRYKLEGLTGLDFLDKARLV